MHCSLHHRSTSEIFTYNSWVAHPALVKIAMDIFDQYMPGPNQYHLLREEVSVTEEQLVDPSVPGKVTDAGVRGNISAALSYCAAWISGNGCVPINFLMEDAATAEIARVQLWQWSKYSVKTVGLLLHRLAVPLADHVMFRHRTRV